MLKFTAVPGGALAVSSLSPEAAPAAAAVAAKATAPRRARSVAQARRHVLIKLPNTLSLIGAALLCAACATSIPSGERPLAIQEQGSFAVGGSRQSEPRREDTLHGDHAYVFYQVPVNARKLPLVLWHGFGQFSKTWETTPDGREGYQNIFLRRGFGVYLVDQPRRGRAGRSTQPATITPRPTNRPGSTFSASEFGRTTSRVCSSRATRKR